MWRRSDNTYGGPKWTHPRQTKIALLFSLGVRELILEKHGKKGPETTRMNKIRQPIDGIWGTIGINIMVGGYLPFNEVPPTDHRIPWISISHSEAFGDLHLPTRYTSSRKLKMRHPRSQEKYISVQENATTYNAYRDWQKSIQTHPNHRQ